MADPKMTKKVAKSVMKNLKVESVLNREGDILPFGLFFPPSDGNFTWNCGVDAEGNVTSVYKSVQGNQKRCEYVTYERAVEIRDTLKEDGWLPIVPPKVQLTDPDTKRPLTRAQKKRVARRLAKMSKKALETGVVDPKAALAAAHKTGGAGPQRGV